MLCKVCNILMRPGTSYERESGEITSRRFNECPKCHFRKYNSDRNIQEQKELSTWEKSVKGKQRA